MQPSDVTLLFDHLYWIRDKILDASEHPTIDWPGEAPIGLRDLRATLVHELDVEWSWRRRLEREDRTDFPPEDDDLVPDDFEDVAAIRDRWLQDEQEMRAWLATLTTADLMGPCRVEKRGPDHEFWTHLQHLYTHGLQQFSDAAWMLSSQTDGSPGEIDFLEFLEAR